MDEPRLQVHVAAFERYSLPEPHAGVKQDGKQIRRFLVQVEVRTAGGLSPGEVAPGLLRRDIGPQSMDAKGISGPPRSATILSPRTFTRAPSRVLAHLSVYKRAMASPRVRAGASSGFDEIEIPVRRAGASENCHWKAPSIVRHMPRPEGVSLTRVFPLRSRRSGRTSRRPKPVRTPEV